MSKILNDLTFLAEAISKDNSLTAEEKMSDIEMLLENVVTFPKYFSSVITMETSLTLYRFKYDRDEYISKAESLDNERRRKHVLAAHSINKINRLAKSYGMNVIFEYPGVKERELKPSAEIKGDRYMESAAKDDREIAADIIYGFCKEVFLDTISKEKYHENIKYTREQRDTELYEIGKSGGYFNEKLTLEELFEEARKNSESKIGNYNEIIKSFEER